MRIAKEYMREFFRILADERGGQNAKSAVGILFFFMFVGGGALLNSSALPLSYNIAFGDSGDGGGGGGGGGGGWGGGGGTGGYSYSQKTKARIDYLTLTVYYDGSKKETKPLGSVSNDVSVGGTGWLYPENAGREDGNRATAEMTFGESSYYLRAINFGFKIPQTARVTGVALNLKRSAEGPDAIKDYSVRLAIGGKTGTADYAKEEAWSAQDEFRQYGDVNDPWEKSLTPDDINNKSFGVEIAARNGGAKLGDSPQNETAVVSATPQDTSTITPSPSTTLSDTEIEALIKKSEKNPQGNHVNQLQAALIRANRGPVAGELAKAGITGYYGTITKRAAAEWRNATTPKTAPVVAKIMPEPVPTPAPTPAIAITPTPQATPPTTAQSGSIEAGDIDRITQIKTPLVRGDSGNDVRTLQKIIIKWNIGPEAAATIATGATGVYGWRTERAVAELQNKIVDAMKGPQAWKLAHAFFKYGKGSWGDATKASVIEYLGSLR